MVIKKCGKEYYNNGKLEYVENIYLIKNIMEKDMMNMSILFMN